MKFKQVPDDDPSAEWESDPIWDGSGYWIHKIEPKEKSNAEIVLEALSGQVNLKTDVGSDYTAFRLNYTLERLLDAVDAKIAKLKKELKP